MEELALPFRSRWWFQVGMSDKYEENELVMLPPFETARDFWFYYQYLKRPEQLCNGDNLYLFREGIKPTWEDEANREGGNFVFKIRKPGSNRVWEELVLGFVGNACPLQIVNGLRLKCEGRDFATIQVWVSHLERNSRDQQLMERWILKTAALDVKLLFSFFKRG